MSRNDALMAELDVAYSEARQELGQISPTY
jgi:hypothetical protein